MVSRHPWLAEGILEYIRRYELLSRGAESELYLGSFLGQRAVFKLRRRKKYMDPMLDRKIRRTRTFKEARIILQAYKGGVATPRLFGFYPSLYLLVLEYIPGKRMKDVIEESSDLELITLLSRNAGYQLGQVHSSGIVHGDTTTSNFILYRDQLYVIDFGLSDFSKNVEDRAVDLHLFRRSIESTHAKYSDIMYSSFLEGYRENMGSIAEEIIEKAEEIRLRGRYIEERRTVWRDI